MHALAAHGYVLNDLDSDTALAAYLALPGQRTRSTWPTCPCGTCTKELRDDATAASGQLTLDMLR